MTCADRTGTPLVIVHAVQIVDIDHPTHFLDVLPYFSKVHAVRCGFQEHVHDLAEQQPGARNDHYHDDKRGDGVEGRPPGDQDQYSGGDDGQRTE
jgi:hypothetical protein